MEYNDKCEDKLFENLETNVQRMLIENPNRDNK